MDLDSLKTFLVLAETKNFRNTADILFLAQSTVTSRIKSLELELGKPLFIRTNKSVTLTASGQAFIAFAHSICETAEHGIQTLNNTQNYKDSLTFVAPISSYDNPLLFDFLHRFIADNPQISFRFLRSYSEDILRNFHRQKYDLGITYLHPYSSNVQSELLFNDEFILAASPGLPLPDVGFSPDTIGLFPFIRMDWGIGFNEAFRQLYPVQPCAIEVDHMSLYMNFILSGQGIGFIPYSVSKPYLENHTLVSVPYCCKDKPFLLETYLVYHHNHSYAVDCLIRSLRHLKSIASDGMDFNTPNQIKQI